MPIANSTRKYSVAANKQDELLSTQITYFVPPEDMKLTRTQKLKKFCWDPKTQQFIGRNAVSWSKIGLFYLTFYGMLAALVSICMWVFFQTLDPRIPRWQVESSIIGSNPGLGFRPMPADENVESTLIWLNGANKSRHVKWVDNLMGYLDEYYTPGKVEKGSATVIQCSYTRGPKEGELCGVSVEQWKLCTREKNFGFDQNAPCVFLKLNRIYGWVPDFYNDIRDLPPDMPKSLVDHIVNNTKQEERDTVWVSCAGENPADMEFIGPITYYPEIQGFPGYYYPYKNGEGYLSPLVAVKFHRPKPGLVLNVECKAWAKNIRHSRVDRLGSVHFELLVDS